MEADYLWAIVSLPRLIVDFFLLQMKKLSVQGCVIVTG